MSSRQKEDSARKYATAHVNAHKTGEPEMNAGSLLLDLKVRLYRCCQCCLVIYSSQ